MKHWWRGFDKGWLVAALLPLIGILPTLYPNHVIDTADGLFHVHRIFAMTELLRAGDPYPRWIPWFHLGYGYPVFNFYAPAASYLGGLLGLAGIAAPAAYTLVASLAWVGGSVGMYGLARRWLPAGGAILAAALWAYAPARIQDVWNIGNLSGIIGTALLPWLFYTLARAVEQPGYRAAALLGLTFGAVILAHQPTTVLAALYLIPALLLMSLWTSRRDWRTLLPRLTCAGGGLALGVGLSLVFTLPLLLELNTIKASLPAADIPSVLLSNFLGFDQLFQPPAAPDLSDLSRRLPDTLGLLGGLLGAAGFLALLWKRRWGLALAWGAALAWGIFLLLDASFDLWLALPLLDQLRFPARVLRIAVIFLALLGGATAPLFPRRYAPALLGALLAVVIGGALPTLYPSRDFVDFSDLSARDEILYELETYAFGGTSYNEFKPVWAARTPFDQPPDTDGYAAHPLRITAIDPALPDVEIAQTGDTVFQVQAGAAFDFSLRQFYFPGWAAWVDGAPVEVFPATDLGLLTLNVPPGDHTVTLAYTGTPAQHLAPWLTLASLALIAGLFRRGQRAVTEPVESLSPRFAAAAMLGIIAFAILNTVYITPHTRWFRQQSPLDAPAAMQTPVHIPFGDAYDLLGYTLHNHAAAPGQPIRLTLFWRALRPLDRDYRPQVQVVNPRQTEAWATSEGFFVGSSPAQHRPDYFISDVHLPRIFDGAPPYTVHLVVRLIDPATGDALPLPDGSERLTLAPTVRVTGNGAQVAQALDYRLGDTLELWCASAGVQGDQLRVDLYWHVLSPPDNPTLRVFVHGLDAAGELVEQADAPPLNGDYAPADWLPGQTLADTYLLPADPAITQVAVGLYIPGVDRLPVTQSGQPVPDNRILLPVTADAC